MATVNGIQKFNVSVRQGRSIVLEIVESESFARQHPVAYLVAIGTNISDSLMMKAPQDPLSERGMNVGIMEGLELVARALAKNPSLRGQQLANTIRETLSGKSFPSTPEEI